MTAFYRFFIGLILAEAALLGFALFYVMCALGELAVWWQEDRQWSRQAVWSKDPGASTSTHVVSPVADPSGRLSSTS
jgi:hypothetical protein